jgi:hypothetical protein
VSPAANLAENNSPAVAELTSEELARLPRIEDFTAETDLTPFLRSGVPAALRNAALRRMWALDATIRDGVGDALDYAYDWNIAGGVPGSGPLLPTDDVEAMVRSIMGRPAAEPSAEPSTDAQAADGSPAAAGASPDKPQLSSTPAADETPAGPRAREVAESAKPPAGKQEALAQTRRHGGATPF